LASQFSLENIIYMTTASDKIDLPQITKQAGIIEYSSGLQNQGISVVQGNEDYIWTKFEGLSAIRFPEFNTVHPTKTELQNVFKKLKCLIINYTILPTNNNSANSILYNCTNNSYDAQSLAKKC